MFSFFWLPWPKAILRIAVTTLSAALIFVGGQHQTIILANHVLSYIGDISYVLYLVHWPIFVIVNSYSCHASFAQIAGIAISVNLAVVVHHLFESHYQKWPPFVILPLLIALVMISFMLYFAIYKQPIEARKNFTGPMSYDGSNPSDAAWNMTSMRQLISTGFDAHSNANMTFCKKEIRTSTDMQARVYCTTKGTGSYKILVIGNSFAVNQAHLVYNAFRNYSSEFTVFHMTACEIMTTTDPSWCGAKKNYNYSAVLYTVEPDIVFVLIRSITTKTWFDSKRTVEEDAIFKEYMDRMRLIESVAKKVYLLQALPSCVDGCVQKALDFTYGGRPLRDIEEGLIVRDDFFARQRISEVGRRCKKCEIIDYLPLLVDKNGRYLGYDSTTNLMYLDRNNHFNRFGKERIQILFNRLAEELRETKL
ncbi:hypothetical protein Aduo_003611 [Ancylostoma duodenale]